MLKRETSKRTPRRTAGRPDGSSPVPAWWMICRSGKGHIEAMTLHCSFGEALALFGHEEEAELFLSSLQAEGIDSGWRIRETRRGEIASVLYDPCANTKRVVLDPLPTMIDEGTIALASMDRTGFVTHLLAREERGSDLRKRVNASSPRCSPPAGSLFPGEPNGADSVQTRPRGGHQHGVRVRPASCESLAPG